MTNLNKKRLSLVLLVLYAFNFLNIFSAVFADEDLSIFKSRDHVVVIDDDSLSVDEINKINERILKIYKNYKVEVVIHIINNDSLKGEDAFEAADAFLIEKGYGTHKNYSPSLLYIDYKNRKISIRNGNIITRIFDEIENTVHSAIGLNLKNKHTFKAVSVFLDFLERELNEKYHLNKAGELKKNSELVAFLKAAANNYISKEYIAISLVISAIICIVIRLGGKSTSSRSHLDYEKENAFNLNYTRDIFISSHISKTAKNKSSSGGSGGGGSSSSGGYGGGNSSF